jgi:cytochrome c oxidase cbb3-type subunit 4
MHTYSLMREFADSWMLLAMSLFFLGVILWVLRPGARTTYDTAATVIFRHDDCPAPQETDR